MALEVALAQIAPVWLDRGATLEKIIATLDEAAQRGAQLAVFGQFEYDLTETVTVSLGARWYDIDDDYKGATTTVNAIDMTIAGATLAVTAAEKSVSKNSNRQPPRKRARDQNPNSASNTASQSQKGSPSAACCPCGCIAGPAGCQCRLPGRAREKGGISASKWLPRLSIMSYEPCMLPTGVSRMVPLV